MDFKYLAGKIALGIASPKDYAGWAERMLISGSNSQSIAILAGLDVEKFPDTDEIKHYFKQSLIDLKLELPSEEQSILDYAVYICHEIIDGKIPSEDAVSVLNDIYSKSNYEPIYKPLG
jgi:hypothetical protein